MRIEKISENQIRCFLSREEMERRDLHLKELAYGTEKAKQLFHDLMREAYARFGFEAENMPVMIEAVPLHDDSLVLIVTRVDNPEELDTRFSSFAPSVKSGSDHDDSGGTSALGQLLDAIRREITDSGEGTARSADREAPAGSGSAQGKPPAEKKGTAPDAGKKPGNIPVTRKKAGFLPDGQVQLYTFSSLSRAADAACTAAPGFKGSSSLYRDAADGKYYLFLTPAQETDTASFTRALSTFSEFGISEYITPAREQHLREHCEVICAQDAVSRLARLGE